MYRFLLKPKWIAFHLLCLAAIAGMLTAGGWQLGRHFERQRFKDDVIARTDADVVPFESLDLSDPAAVEWRRVQVTGFYLPDKNFTVVNVSQDGSGGTDAVSGLALDDSTVLIVNRGFVAAPTKLPTAPTGEVSFVARIRLSQTAGFGQVADDGTQTLTEIRRVDLGALSQQFTEKVQPVYVDQIEMKYEPSYVKAVAFPNLDGGPPHLSYTIQWFVFSIAVAVGWVLAVRKSARERNRKFKPRTRKHIPIDDSRSKVR
jgi:cytochrome oxidase assembly protein ShyY1